MPAFTPCLMTRSNPASFIAVMVAAAVPPGVAASCNSSSRSSPPSRQYETASHNACAAAVIAVFLSRPARRPVSASTASAWYPWLGEYVIVNASNCGSRTSTTCPTSPKRARTCERSRRFTPLSKQRAVNPRPIRHTGLGMARTQRDLESAHRNCASGIPAARLTQRSGGAATQAATSASVSVTDPGLTARISIAACARAEGKSRAVVTPDSRCTTRAFSGCRSYTTTACRSPASRSPAHRALVIRPPPRKTTVDLDFLLMVIILNEATRHAK